MKKSFLRYLLVPFLSIRSLRRLIAHVLMRVEGGGAFSQSLRSILSQYYGVKVGRYSYGPLLHPGAVPVGTQIGAFCSFAHNITVLRRDHPLDRVTQHPLFFNSKLGLVQKDTCSLPSENPLIIEDDVWIGCNVVICAGCKRIGYASVIAAGAVVICDVPPFSIVGGVPAKVIKTRFNETTRQKLLESRWWELDDDSIHRLLDGFTTSLTQEFLDKLILVRKQHAD